MRPRQDWQQMREGIIGLGDESSRRSYYPELVRRLTQLEEAREQAQEAQDNLQMLFDSLYDAVIIHDLEGRVIEANAAMQAMFGVDEESFRRYSIFEYSAPGFPGEDLRLKLAPIWERVQEGRPHLFRWTCRRPLSTEGSFEVEVSLHRGRWYEQDVFVAVVRDVTERLRLEGMVQQTAKLDALGQLAGGVAHDTNNMLGVIIGYTDMLMEDLPEGHPMAADLGQIRKAAMHSADLTRQLLAFARRQTIQPRPVDLNQLLDTLQKMLRRLIGEQHALVWKPATRLGLVWVDPSQMDQIVTNLVVNARDALGARGGTITLSTSHLSADETYCHAHVDATPGEYVVLGVTDDGCGMSPEVQARIFDPFFTTKEQGKGTGLGLATVYGIVRQNAGFTAVYSAPGMGTAFRVHLPRYAGSELPAGEAAQVVPLGQETLLLVEDEEALLRLAERILTGAGYTVLTAMDPLQAITLMEEHGDAIDLLVTDLVMPNLNGRELYEHLRGLRPTIRPLFMSGYPAGTIQLQDLTEPGWGFLQKPFTRGGLLLKVREVLDGVTRD